MYQPNPGQGWIQEFFVGAHLKNVQKITSAPKFNDFSYVFKHILKKFENTPAGASTNPKNFDLDKNWIWYELKNESKMESEIDIEI